MAKRREKGDGSIYQRESDKMWVACAHVPETGKRKYVYAKTRKEVAAKLKELQHIIDQGTLVAARSETVEAFLRYWLDIHKARIKESTLINYTSHVNSCVPYIGQVKLTKLAGDHLQLLYVELGKKKKKSSLHVLHTILKAALQDAIRWRRLVRNPCNDIDAPPREKQERPILKAEQSKMLLKAAQDTRIECFLAMALTTGMRRGEMLGLRWADIDMEQKFLSVQRTASYIKVQGQKYAFVESSPKTKASKRSIRLTDFLVTTLKAHKKKQLEMRLQAGQEWAGKDLVFCNSSGEHFPVHLLEDNFKQLLQSCGLSPLHFHDLRHSCATLLASMRVPAKVIQEILGHSSIVVTQDLYGHVIEGMQDEAMKKMDGLFKREEAN